MGGDAGEWKNRKYQGRLVSRTGKMITVLKHENVAPQLWIVGNYLKRCHDFSQEFKKVFLIMRKEKHWKSLSKGKLLQ